MLSTLLTFIFGDAGRRSGTRESTGPEASGDGSGTGAPSLLGPRASAALGARESAAAAGKARGADAGAGGGRRGAPGARRGAALGSGGARVARGPGATGWKREPLTASPRARRPLPSPPLPPAAKSLDWGGADLGALTTEHPDLKETGGDSESCPVPPRALLAARSAGSAEGLQGPTPSHRGLPNPPGAQTPKAKLEVAAQS